MSPGRAPWRVEVAQNLPYLSSNKNLGELFQKIYSAKKPDAFTHAFLKDTLGLKGSNDRSMIAFLKSMGFLDPAGRPLPPYDLLKNQSESKAAISEGIKRAYAPLFEANEGANALSAEQLKGLVSQVAGTDEDMTARIANTFTAVAKLGDFSKKAGQSNKKILAPEGEKGAIGSGGEDGGSFRPDFHYNIEIHLPANGSEETYLNIFNAIRKTFK
jgi:hypothetical protein